MNKKRALPDWMSNDESMLRTTFDNETNEVPRPSRRLRSNYSFKELENETPKIKTQDLPFIEYKGKIKYFNVMADIASACFDLITYVENYPDDIIPCGFDMEWPFSFQTGPGKASLIQLCFETDVCFLFHLSKLNKLPKALLELLAHKRVMLHGVNIKNDLRKLERDFPEAKTQLMIDQCLDLGVWCNSVENTSGRWSLERLVLQICKLRINKDKAVRMSQWHVVPLNEPQKIYAAIDVYIGQVIYRNLKEKELKKEQELEAFTQIYGDKSLKVVNSLN